MEREMGQADCCGISSSADSVPDRCGEEGTELEGKAFQIYQSITSNYSEAITAAVSILPINRTKYGHFQKHSDEQLFISSLL